MFLHFCWLFNCFFFFFVFTVLLKCDSAQACCYLNENGCKIAAHITTTSDLSRPSAHRNITSFHRLKIHARVISMPCIFYVVIADVVGL